MPTAAPGGDSHVASDVMMALGDTARLVDSLEIRPMEGMAPAAPHKAAKTPVAPLAPLPPAAGAAEAEGMVHASAAVQTAAAATAAVAPMVIDIPKTWHWPSMAMSADQQKRLHELMLAGSSCRSPLCKVIAFISSAHFKDLTPARRPAPRILHVLVKP